MTEEEAKSMGDLFPDLGPEAPVISGIAHDRSEALATVRGVPNEPGMAAKEELIDRLVNYTSKASELELPHAPKHFIQYLTEDDRPQVKLDVDYEGGMGVSIGRLREDSIFDWKFVGLAHNTLRGAAGGALECAEMLKALGYITKK